MKVGGGAKPMSNVIVHLQQFTSVLMSWYLVTLMSVKGLWLRVVCQVLIKAWSTAVEVQRIIC